MNPVESILATAVAAASWAIWARRHTFASRTERPLTLSVILCIVGITLISPQSTDVVGGIAHALTGIWHLDTFAGDLSLMASQICALSALLGSLFTDDERAAWLRFWVQPAITVVVPAMTACIIATSALRNYVPNILDATPDVWLAAYWLLVIATSVYLWLAGLRALWIIRTDRQSRAIANAYMIAMGCGVVGGVAHAVWVLAGVQPLGHGLLTWSLVCIAYVGTCLTAAWSWRLKERRLLGARRRKRRCRRFAGRRAPGG